MSLNQNADSELWDEIQKQFEKIKQEAGVEPDEEYQAELEELLGSSMEDLQRELLDALKIKEIKVKKLHPDAVFPKYNYPSDSGFDLHSTETIEIPAFGRSLVPTGISVQFGEGHEIQVRPKSGLAINMGITVLNTPGTVDQGYTGEIKVIVFNTNNHPVIIDKGMKIAQAVLCPVLNGKYVNLSNVDEIKDTDRGDNGFGSTGII
jgi:dUTP pyrophosphatase